MELRQHCAAPARRQLVADREIDTGDGTLLNGLDYLEVIDSAEPDPAWRQRRIELVFIRPDGLTSLGPLNFEITGGERVRGVDVAAVSVKPGDDRALILELDRVGDFSTYELWITDGVGGRVPGFIDPALSRIAFSFKVECPTSFDCKDPGPCRAALQAEPALSYLAKDYDSFRRMMLDRMAATIPAWSDRNPADLGVTLVELLADVADRASYFQDAVATESHLPLARLRASILRHARLLNYAADHGANARTAVSLTAAPGISLSAPTGSSALLPVGTKLLTTPPDLPETLPPIMPRDPRFLDRAVRAGAVVFETLSPVRRLRHARNQIRLHDWGDGGCCLPKGSTVAHLIGSAFELDLRRGDLVIFEELIPAGGVAEDVPDPEHRQLVRISDDPVQLRDKVLELDVLEIRWDADDALRFPLNLAGDGAAPASVVRGNVVLADEGRTIDFGDPAPEDMDAAQGRGLRDGDVRAPGRAIRAQLDVDRLVYAAPFNPIAATQAPALQSLAPECVSAPSISLRGAGETWSAVADLLASDRFAPEFKVEPTVGGGAVLLFGDGVNGREPTTAELESFSAQLRRGVGVAGNVGADAIGHILTDDLTLLTSVRNPIPAIGARAPETNTSIKISAPQAFRVQKRAVTPADYVMAAEQFSGVQRAMAERRWTGSWSTMFLSVDRIGGEPVDADFEGALRAHLESWRLAGHDLEITDPRSIGLNLVLMICVEPDHVAAEVERDLLERLGAGYRRDGARGFFHPDNFTFGQPARLSALVAEAMQGQGVGWVGVTAGKDTAFGGRFERQDQPGVDYSAAGEIPIGPREVARMENDPDFPERGRLRLAMRGGR